MTNDIRTSLTFEWLQLKACGVVSRKVNLMSEGALRLYVENSQNLAITQYNVLLFCRL